MCALLLLFEKLVGAVRMKKGRLGRDYAPLPNLSTGLPPSASAGIRWTRRPAFKALLFGNWKRICL